jgi:hypothetical protein
LRKLVLEAPLTFLPRRDKEEKLGHPGRQIVLDLPQHRLDPLPEDTTQSGDRFIFAYPLGDEEGLNQLRPGKLRLRAEIAQVSGRT